MKPDIVIYPSNQIRVQGREGFYEPYSVEAMNIMRKFDIAYKRQGMKDTSLESGSHVLLIFPTPLPKIRKPIKKGLKKKKQRKSRTHIPPK